MELVDEHSGFRILKRSGNLCVWMIFASGKELFGAAALRLKERVEQIGGKLDGGTKRTLIFTIPLRAGWPTIERAFNDAVATPAGSTSFFPHFSDPKSGEPPHFCPSPT